MVHQVPTIALFAKDVGRSMFEVDMFTINNYEHASKAVKASSTAARPITKPPKGPP